MGVEQSRGGELPVGNSGPATAAGVRMQILATEHWSLLATRQLGYTDSFSRVGMFFSVLSGAVIALALIAQAGRFNQTFFVAAILLLSIVIFVGVITTARVGQLNLENIFWVIGMNRIRHAYLEMHPDLEQYFVTSPHDDTAGIFMTLGMATIQPGGHPLRDIGQGFQTLPGMLTVIIAVVAGAWGALVAVALGADQPVAIGAGAVGFVLLVVAMSLYGRRAVGRISKVLPARFPSD